MIGALLSFKKKSNVWFRLEKIAKTLEEVKKERSLMLLLAKVEAFQNGKNTY